MKKIFIILCFMFLFIGFTDVYAADFSTYLSGNKSITANSNVTITVGVNNAKNLWGFRAPINYDSTKLKLVGTPTGLNGFGVAVGTSFVADNSTGKNGSFKVATLTFKATSNFKVGDSATISLGTAEGSDGNKIMTGSGSSITIKVVPPKSGNNNLKSLSIEGQNINFNKDKTNYSITVDHNVDKIRINATKEDDKASISGTGEKELNLYSNTFSVVVTAENGSKKTYNIEVIRKDIDGNIKELSKDNSLAKLEISGYDLVFDANVFEYTILLKNPNNELKIDALATDSNATVTVKNLDSYQEGNNVIEISVIAENGQERVYKINAISLLETKVVEDNNDTNNVLSYAIICVESAIILGTLATGIILNKKGKLIINK